MAYPDFQAVGPATAIVSGLTSTGAVEWPTHIAGDLGILAIGSNNFAEGVATPTIVVDTDVWTLIRNSVNNISEPGNPSNIITSVRMQTYYRIAESTSEPDVDLSLTGACELIQARIITFRNHDPVNPINGSSTSDHDGIGLFTVGGPVTTADDCLILFAIQTTAAAAFGTYPFGGSDPDLSNFTNRCHDTSSAGPADGSFDLTTAEEVSQGSTFGFLLDTNSLYDIGHSIALTGFEPEPPEPPDPTVTAPFPDALSQEGYQNTFGDMLIEIPLSGGLSRRRQDSYFAGHMVTVQWLLTRQEYAQFMGFFKTSLRHAVDPFLIDVITDIGVPTTHKARTVGGIPTLNRQSGDAYYVSCTLQCEKNPTYTGNIIYQEDGDIVFAVDNPTFAEGFAAGDTLRIIDSAGIHPTGSTPINLDGEYTVLSTTGFNVVTLDNPASVNSDWTVLAGLGSGIEYGDEDNGNVISTVTRVPT